jgi:Aconitase family (aconitate hydratase)/Phosphoenolpyruvate phosphomutase
MVARVLGDVPLIADAGTAYGAELNVVRTVREYEAAGVAAIQLEDQAFPKKCGHLPDKELVPAEEFTRRLGAALGARTDPDLVLIARTDARGPLGLDAAIERANAYAQAGADVIFVEAPQGTDEIERIAKEVDAPLLLNLVIVGLTSMQSTERLRELGFAVEGARSEQAGRILRPRRPCRVVGDRRALSRPGREESLSHGHDDDRDPAGPQGRVERVRVGDTVTVDVDLCVLIDLQFATLWLPPSRIHDPEKVAVVMDHAVPAPSLKDAEDGPRARKFAADFGIERFFDVGRHGICHRVIAENALARPGEVLACTDSHTCAAGAYNTAARGLGPAEVYSIMCTGRTWFQVAPTIRYELEGTKPEGVSGKDIFLHIAGEYGDATNMNLEYGGPGLASVPMNDRRTIATQGAEVSADFSTFAWTMCCGSSSRSAVSRGTERPTPTPMPNTTTSGTSTCRAWSPTSRGPGR